MKRWTIPLAAVLVAVGATIAVAAIPDANGVIHGCRDNRTGALRVIDSEAGQTCGNRETALSWSQTGPAGPPGPQGPQGEPGPGTTIQIFTSGAQHTIPANERQEFIFNCQIGQVAMPMGWQWIGGSPPTLIASAYANGGRSSRLEFLGGGGSIVAFSVMPCVFATTL